MSYGIDIFRYTGAGDPEEYIDELLDNEEVLDEPPDAETLAACEKLKQLSYLSFNEEGNQFVSEELGLTIDFSGSLFGVNLAYWHSDADAIKAFEALEKIYKTINSDGSWLIHDPQDDDNLVKRSLISGGEASFYSATTTTVQNAVNKPWWKFW